jgi:prevent-host-death family protein
MPKVSIAEAKDRLAALVGAAEAGETIVITRHGKPVAELRPVAGPVICSPASLDWIEDQLKRFPAVRGDIQVEVRAMRDED